MLFFLIQKLAEVLNTFSIKQTSNKVIDKGGGICSFNR